jgi:hypothetical protein
MAYIAGSDEKKWDPRAHVANEARATRLNSRVGTRYLSGVFIDFYKFIGLSCVMDLSLQILTGDLLSQPLGVPAFSLQKRKIMATRYDQKTKDEVVAYIQQYNEEKGRGGQSAAVNKWKLNPITVKSWLEKAGVETPGKGGKKKRKPGRPAKAESAKAPKASRAVKAAKAAKAPRASKAESGDDGVSSTLQRMIAIQSQIVALQNEYGKLKGKL